MNMDRAQHSGTRLSDPPTDANEPAPGAPEPITKHPGRFLPSTRYRHPGDVIRLIGSLEICGALGLIVPKATGYLPWLTPVAAGGLVLTMMGAIRTHVRLH